jgi:peptide/nickel transport system permease protein
VIPADPIGAMLGPQAPLELIEKTKAKWGLDKPLYEQYLIYVSRLFQGDLGTSIRTYNSVAEDLIQFFPATLELATTASITGVVFGVLLGVISAVKSGRIIDHIVRIFSLIGLSMPVFWLGIILLLIFYHALDWLPGAGQLPFYVTRPPRVTGLITLDSLIAGDFDTFISAIRHLIMPAFILGWFSMAAIARITRASMLEVLKEEYINTARAKGLKEMIVVMKHALKNAMLPVITIIGITYGGLLEGSVLTETVFAWPGLGRYATHAFLSVDFPAVIGATLLIALIYSLVNLIVDISYAFLNPKIKYD